MKSAACALALLAVAATAPAKTITAEKLGVALDLPEGWTDSEAIARMARPPAQLIAGVASPDGTRNFIAMCVTLDPHEAGTPDSFQQGLLNSLKSQGFIIGEISTVTIHGVSFESRTATTPGGTVPRMQFLSTFGNGRAFTISASSGTGDPRLDADLQTALQSFRFLAPPKPLQPVNPAFSVGYKAGRTLGMLAGGTLAIIGLVACPAALIIGGYFVFRKKK